MKDQFVNFDIAIKLKELGFNEECFGYYCYYTQNVVIPDQLDAGNRACIAPLWQQVTEWIKLNYNICITQTPSIIVDSWIVVDADSKCVGSFTKEQAILKALTLIK